MTRWLLSTVLLVGIAGCKQGEGDRCQVNADCAEGLICVLPAGATPQAGGVCQLPGGGDMAVEMIDMAMPDLVPADLTQQDLVPSDMADHDLSSDLAM